MNTDDQQTPDEQQTPPPAGEDEQQTPGEDQGAPAPGDEDEDPQTPPADEDEDEDQEDSDTFPRAYVKRLRARSAGYRERAKTAEERASTLERELFTERVRALDVLADPTDLEFNADLLDDRDALEAAVTELVRARPHYRRRGTSTPDGTGSRARSTPSDTVSLSAIMRGNA